MKIIENVILDLRKDFAYKITAKQDDIDSRFLSMAILNNGQKVNLTDHTVKLYVKKPDDTIIFTNALITDAVNGIVEIELTSQTLAVAGLLKCELVIYGTDASVASSKIFFITVETSLRDDTAIESQNEFGALVDAMSELSEYENYKSKINEISAKTGTSTLGTIAQDLSEAVNELVYSDNTIQAQLADIVKVDIKKYGAVGDGVTNDYQAFVDACAEAGSNGIVFFPETSANVYYMSNGQSGTSGRITMYGKPYFSFASPKIKLKYYYDPDLKYLKTLNAFLLEWNGVTKTIDPVDFRKKESKVMGLDKNPSQVLEKINFTTDVTPQTFGGQTFVNITNLAFVTADSMKIDTPASGYNLITKPLAIGKYFECLLEKDSTVPTSGMYLIGFVTDKYAYLWQFDALTYFLNLVKWYLTTGTPNGGAYITIPTQYQLKENVSLFYGIKNVDGKTFEIYVNGYLVDKVTIGNDETYANKVAVGHIRHLNNMVTFSYGLEISNYNNPKYKSLKYMAFGDSITFGAYSPIDYPKIVGEILYREKSIRDLRVENKGVSGDTSTGCLTQVNNNLNNISSDTIVTVMIGTNDCIMGASLETYISNMTSIIDAIHSKTQKLIVSSFPVYGVGVANYQNIAKYNARLKQLCISKNVKFVDNMANLGYTIDISGDLYLDSIHPTEEGQLILAKGFADAIVEIV